ncbi:hypothetical protein GOP47_0027563 [Adiantum capillus-veneris]|nr:hypothetical protein GOP47_0027563 [Adiantum capillus-veneris]
MSKQKHAIVYAWPGQGHTNPLLRFSELLAQDEGCRVTFVHSQQNLTRVRKAAAAAGSSEEDEIKSRGQLEFVGIDDGLPEGHARDLPSLIVATDAQRQGGLVASFDSLVARLLQADRETSTTFIVSDFFMSFTQEVANKYGLPRVGVWVQSAASFACHVAVVQGFRPLPGAKLLNCLPEMLPSTTLVTEMISFLQDYDPSDPLFDYMIRSFKQLNEPTCILLNTFDELEHNAIDYLRKSDINVKHWDCCGPLLPPSYSTRAHGSNKFANESLWEEDHGCLKWLDEQIPSSVLFVSFGSLFTLSACQAEELAYGLEDSKVPFLWVIREGLIEDGDFPDAFVERVRERACFVSWAPQMKVLMHPSVGGFLTHAGWNSVLEGIGAGVPLLGWPSFGDQMLNCRCIIDSWGVGLSYFGKEDHNEEGLVSRVAIEKKIRALMLELPPAVKRNCASLKEAASKSAQTRLSALIPVLDSLREGSLTI